MGIEEKEKQILHNKNSSKEIRIFKKENNINSENSAENASLWTKLLAFTGYATTLGTAVPAGYCTGVMNSPAMHMRSWCSEAIFLRYNQQLSASSIDILWSAIVSIFLIGGAVGSLSGAWVANKLGRKSAVLICNIFFLLGGILFFACRPFHSVEMLILARFLVGLAAGLTTASLPMYLMEIAPLELRGTMGVFCPIGLTTGVVVSQIFSLQILLGSAAYWHLALSLYGLLTTACSVSFMYYPESPKWLYVVKNRRDLAHKELTRLHGKENKDLIDEELHAIEEEKNLKDQSSSFAEVLRDPTLLLPLVLVCAFQGGQQLSGINAIFYYSVSIFRKAGLSTVAAEWTNLAAGALNLLISLLGPFLMSKINRRSLMLFSTFFCLIALSSFAVMLYYIEYVPCFAFGCIACIFLYIFFFQFGLGPIPFFIGSELFEVSPRPVAMSMGSLTSWSCNFVVGMAFSSLQTAWGSLVFLPFAITCVVLFLLTKFYLPETLGKDPAEVAPLMAYGFKSIVNGPGGQVQVRNYISSYKQKGIEEFYNNKKRYL